MIPLAIETILHSLQPSSKNLPEVSTKTAPWAIDVTINPLSRLGVVLAG
jgi:hypothetical protein